MSVEASSKCESPVFSRNYKMAPRTAAERQRAYRLKLKNENPEKLKAIKKKNSERALNYYRTKIQTLTEEQKTELRLKRKHENQNTKELNNRKECHTNNTENISQERLINCTSTTNTKKYLRRLEYKRNREMKELKKDMQKLWKKFEALQKRCYRQQKKIDQLQESCEKLETQLQIKTSDVEILNQIDYTPLKKTENFIKENLNDAKTPQKKAIQETLLEHNVLKESLKNKYSLSSNETKKILKEVIDSDIVRKYKLKTRLTQAIGLKSNFEKYRNRKQETTKLIHKIQEFYIRDDVSRASAGKKEYKSSKKIKMQKRYLMDTLRTLHKKFLSEVGKISFSTFKKYRPFYVVQPRSKDLDSCACTRHCNMKFLAKALKAASLVNTDCLDDIIATLVCDKLFKSCMYGTCAAYKVKFLRNKGNSKFAWPITDDISLIYEDDIEKRDLKLINERRGIKIFDLNDFSVLPLTLGSRDIWMEIQNGIDKFLDHLHNSPTGQSLLEVIKSVDIGRLTKELDSPEGQRFMGNLQSPEGQEFVQALRSPEGQRYLDQFKTTDMRGYVMRCTLPPYPRNGRYVVKELPNGNPGDMTQFVTLDVICDRGYIVANMRTRYYCVYGFFGTSAPTECVRSCQLDLNAESVEYSNCIFPGSRNASQCTAEVPAETTVRTSKCRQADYFSTKRLPEMNCIDGEWDVNNALGCRLDCGRVTPREHPLVLNGTTVKHGDLPWHVGVYDKSFKVPKNICGGTIVKTDVVISAAHCFWDDAAKKVIRASNYAVAAGKIYPQWTNNMDVDAQKSELKNLFVPEMFRGTQNNFANDIALLFLTTPFTYTPYIKPVCFNFGQNFEKSDLVNGKLGTVTGWGYTLATGHRSGVLKTTSLPYVPLRECIDRVPNDFKQLLVDDKICAGYDDGTSTLCEGDSGGGLVFPRNVTGEIRYYLYGIVSTSPNSEQASHCNDQAIVTFTRLSKHKDFIRNQLLAAVHPQAPLFVDRFEFYD